MLWLWMGAETAAPDLIPDFSCLDQGAPGVVSKRDWIEMDVDYQLVNDNLLDLSHASFLHRGVLGDPSTPQCEIEIDGTESSVTVTRNRSNIAPLKRSTRGRACVGTRRAVFVPRPASAPRVPSMTGWSR